MAVKSRSCISVDADQPRAIPLPDIIGSWTWQSVRYYQITTLAECPDDSIDEHGFRNLAKDLPSSVGQFGKLGKRMKTLWAVVEPVLRANPCVDTGMLIPHACPGATAVAGINKAETGYALIYRSHVFGRIVAYKVAVMSSWSFVLSDPRDLGDATAKETS